MKPTRKDYRDYAKKHDMVVLALIPECYSGEIIGIAVKTETRFDGVPYYTFGRLYHTFGDNFHYEQQGIYSTTDEMEVRHHAYRFFGLN